MKELGVLQFRNLESKKISMNLAWYCADCDAIVEGTNLVACPECDGMAVWSFLELMASSVRRKRVRRAPRSVESLGVTERAEVVS